MNRFLFKIWILFISVIIGVMNITQAQDIQLTASVNKTSVGLNESFEYSIQVSGKKTNLPDPSIPQIDDLAILGGPNSSTSIQFVNGNMSASKTLTYIVQPRRLGKITIPAATLDTGNGVISSNEVTLTVTKSAGKPQQKSPAPKSTTDSEITGENLFLKVVSDKRNVFQNEQVIITYKLYFRVSVRSYNVDKIPANIGFWTEEFKLPSQPPIETEVINGLAYQVATLRKVAVFSTKTGKLEIEPMVITVDALIKRKRSSRSIFDSFFDDPFGRTVRKMVSSKPLVLNVKALPKEKKPADFNGEVGRYSLKVTSDKTELQANEAVSIKVVMSGNGNIKLLKSPVPKISSDMEVYDPKESTNITRNKEIISGKKTVEYIVVPRFPGDYKIRPLTFSYFDPVKKSYTRLTSDPISLKILPGTTTPGSPLASGNLSKQDVELLGEDIRFIKETANFFISGSVIYKQWYYIALYFLPLISLVITWIYSLQRAKVRSDADLARRLKAGKIASKHLATAKKYLKPDHQREFYREMSLALQGYVCDKLNIQLTDFNLSIVEKKLHTVNLDNNLVKDYQECLQESDYKQFSGSSSDFDEMKTFFERTGKILTQLEKYI
jgi:hypothetical protein